MTEPPKLPVPLGTHAAVWFIGDREVSGEFEARAFSHPALSLYGEVERPAPSRHEFERLAGRLRSGQDVVLRQVEVTEWFPGRGLGGATTAVVGLNIAEVPDDAYRRVRLQITGSETLFGVAPIRSVRFPGPPDQPGAELYSAEANPDADHSWDDEELGITATCAFESRCTYGDPFHYELAFAPIVELTSRAPLTVEQWIATWVRPLLKVAALATRRPQKLSWLVVEALPPGDQERRSLRPSGQLFGSGIAQEAYEAKYPGDPRGRENRPLFTFATMPVALPVLLRRWRECEEDNNPFVELFGQALAHGDLPARARFLHLVQALEALHSYEHRADDESAQRAFETKRAEVLAALKVSDIERAVMEFIRENWSRRRQDSLSRRLDDLIQRLPAPARESLVTSEMTTVAEILEVSERPILANQYQRLRNHLSHGSRNFGDSELRPWVRSIERLCRGQALRLLGFDDIAIESALAT